MKSLFKNNRIVVISVFAATTILLATFVLNGSQYEDAWLYLTGLWIVLLPLFDVYFKKKKH